VGVAGLAFAMIALLRWPLVAVLAGLGGAAMALAWRRLPP
jgi:chromate transporter